MLNRFTSFFQGTPLPKPISEADQKRESLHNVLMYGQYGALIYAAYLLMVEGRFWSSIGVATMSTYLERLYASFYERTMQDPETARYLASRYSKITQFSKFADLAVIPALEKIKEQITIQPPTRN